jgi:thiosulfate/3-mercaptopyruvate sulfurtransferase
MYSILPPAKGDVQEIYNKERLPKARYFGLDDICNKSTNLPHMLPSLEQFENEMKRLDIANNDVVVFYDDFGIVGACRGW